MFSTMYPGIGLLHPQLGSSSSSKDSAEQVQLPAEAPEENGVCVHACPLECLKNCKHATPQTQYCITTEIKTKFPEQLKVPEGEPLIS